MKIASWNLLHRSGASVEEIATILESEKPDLFLMQEVTSEIIKLPGLIGGHFLYQPWSGKTYGMAIWSPSLIKQASPIDLPYSNLPGSFPKRAAQTIRINDMTVANVHLSHGQILNRRQLSKIAQNTDGPTVIMGDFNAVGPVKIREFDDVGPRFPTHKAQKLIPFRLDRCLIRDLECSEAKILDPRGSDHHPIAVSLN